MELRSSSSTHSHTSTALFVSRVSHMWVCNLYCKDTPPPHTRTHIIHPPLLREREGRYTRCRACPQSTRATPTSSAHTAFAMRAQAFYLLSAINTPCARAAFAATRTHTSLEGRRHHVRTARTPALLHRCRDTQRTHTQGVYVNARASLLCNVFLLLTEMSSTCFGMRVWSLTDPQAPLLPATDTSPLDPRTRVRGPISQ